MSEFLDNLKRAADTGEFNSDAAKKIIEIHDLADGKFKGKNVVEEVEKIKNKLKTRQEELVENGEIKPVSKELVTEANTEYERKMSMFMKSDKINKQLALLIEMEDSIKLSIGDMFEFLDGIESMYGEELKTDHLMYNDLSSKIKSIKSIYKTIIN